MDDDFEALIAGVREMNQQKQNSKQSKPYEEGYGHIFSYIPTMDEYLERTKDPESNGRLFIRNAPIRFTNWDKLTNLKDGLLAKLNRNNNSPIFDFRLEIMDGSYFSSFEDLNECPELTARYNFMGEVITRHSGFKKFDREETLEVSQTEELRALFKLNSALIQHCPKLRILSFFGLSFFHAEASIVRSETLEALNLSGVSFSNFPRIGGILNYIFLAAPNIRELHLGDLADLDVGHIFELLNIEKQGQSVFPVPTNRVASKFLDIYEDVKSTGAPHHVLQNVKKLHFFNCSSLIEDHIKGLSQLPHLEELGFRNCPHIEQPHCLAKFMGTTICYGGILDESNKLGSRLDFLEHLAGALGNPVAGKQKGKSQQNNDNKTKASERKDFVNLKTIDIRETSKRATGVKTCDSRTRNCLKALRSCGLTILTLE